MNLKIVKNKYLNGILLLMLISATIHMLILFFTAIVTGDYYLLNYFNILDLDILLPLIFKDTPLINSLALMVVVILYGAILLKNRTNKDL